MDNSIQIFKSEQFGEIRTAGTSEQPLFCLSDVCKALALSNVTETKKRLSTPHLSTIEVGVTTGKRKDGSLAVQKINMNFIDEANLYKCIFMSRKKEAEQFQDWVTSEVLPSIRKTGGYIATTTEESPEEIMAKALKIADNAIKQREERIKALQQENSEQMAQLTQKEERIAKQEEVIKQSAPKVTYYDDVMQSVNTLTSTQVAKMHGMSDASKLNKKLCECGVCYRQSGQLLLHTPFSTWGLHATRTQTYTRSDGSLGTSVYTVWTQKGARFIKALLDCDWKPRKACDLIKAENNVA